MSHAIDEKDHAGRPAADTALAPDPRRPYEPPRVIKRRSIEHATLFTAMGPMATAITVMG